MPEESVQTQSVVDPKQRLLRNVSANWLQMLVSSAIAFVMTPVFVQYLGKEAYGIWAIIWSIIMFTGFFDAGFKQSLARYIPKYYATREWNKLNEVMNSANVIYGISGTLVVLSVFVIAFFFVKEFNVSAEMYDVMRIALILVGFNQAAHFYLMSFTALGPFHRYDIYNAVELSSRIIGTGVTLLLLIEGYGLVALAAWTLTLTLIGMGVKAGIRKRIVPQVQYSFQYLSKPRIKQLFDYSKISFLIVIGWAIIFSADNTVIGLFVSAEAVALYNIALVLVNTFRAGMSAVGTPLVPAFSHLDATSDTTEIAQLHNRIVRYLYYLTAAMCVGVVFYAQDFIGLWMGEGFEDSARVLQLLIIPACIYYPQMMSNSVLLGVGRHGRLLAVIAAEALGNIALSLILVQFWGIYGVALGTAIPQLIIYGIAFPIVFNRTIQSSVGEFYRNSAKAVAVSVVFALPATLLTRYILPTDTIAGFIAGVAFVCIVVFAGFVWLMLSPQDSERIFGRFRGLLSRTEAK